MFSRKRLFAALLLFLAAFGTPSSAVVVAGASQQFVRAGNQKPGIPHAIVEQRTSAPAAPRIRTDFSARPSRRPEVPYRHALFQRPPPPLRVIRS
jgi:hypothetical protein